MVIMTFPSNEILGKDHFEKAFQNAHLERKNQLKECYEKFKRNLFS